MPELIESTESVGAATEPPGIFQTTLSLEPGPLGSPHANTVDAISVRIANSLARRSMVTDGASAAC